MRIRQLPDYIANQIAAGEVIERPASVLKELLENSLDAEASHIELDIEHGGLQRIRITDNGKGIHKEDLLLAVSPHATSKLQKSEDLFNIQTLGFRGEALASIGSIARLQINSCQQADAGAWQVKVEGNSQPELAPASHPLGTTVLVQDLFFNTPARRKFLRSDKTEFHQLEEVFRRIALSHFNTSFSFKHNQRLLYKLPPAAEPLAQEKRIAKIFGNNFLQHALRLEFTISGLTLTGWVGEPSYTRSQADLQYVYLNGRMIRDKLVNHALRQAYEDKIYPGRYPVFLIYLTIDAIKVDVNVHPTKHEVRFHESRLVHDFLYQSLRQVLSPAVNHSISKQPTLAPHTYQLSNQPTYQIKEAAPMTSPTFKQPFIGRLHNQYLLAEEPDGLLLVELEQAFTLISYHAMAQAYCKGNITSKPLLIPIVKTFAESQVKSLEHYLEQLQTLGVNLSLLSNTQIMLRGVPVVLSKLESEKFLIELVAQLSNHVKQKFDLVFSLAKVAGSAMREVSNIEPQTIIAQVKQLQPQALTLNMKVATLINFTQLNKLLQPC